MRRDLYMLEGGTDENGMTVWIDVLDNTGASVLNGMRTFFTQMGAALWVQGFCFGAECAKGDCEHNGRWAGSQGRGAGVRWRFEAEESEAMNRLAAVLARARERGWLQPRAGEKGEAM